MTRPQKALPKTTSLIIPPMMIAGIMPPCQTPKPESVDGSEVLRDLPDGMYKTLAILIG